jgi:hypothetical protein
MSGSFVDAIFSKVSGEGLGTAWGSWLFNLERRYFKI